VKKHRSLIFAAGVTTAVTLLSACSGSGSGSNGASLPSTGAGESARFDPRSGVAPEFLGKLGVAHRGWHHVRHASFAPRQVFVSDWDTESVLQLKYRLWTLLGSIASPYGPDGVWVDKSPGNLYVANYAGPYITEYDTSGKLIFTYSQGISNPVDVTTDRNGNVYDADYDFAMSGGGYVNEYVQHNALLARCYPGGYVEGVAVDKKFDVFAAYALPNGGGAIVEYPRGLAQSECVGTVLPITLDFPGGMVLDDNGNLIVCDQSAPAVDVIAPPYTSITRTLGSGYEDPFHVTIDAAGNHASVTDFAARVVQVLNYPSGTIAATLGSANGLDEPAGAVDSKNRVVAP
jgi:DNA-binding beta-propeller fold protein YncE